MSVSLAINETLLDTACQINGGHSQNETINHALEEYVQRHKADALINMFGKIEYDADYDYKKMRYR